MSTTDICRTVFSRARIESALFASNVSAQSPPMRTNARPWAASASRVPRTSHSPANTSGGSADSSSTRSAQLIGIRPRRLLGSRQVRPYEGIRHEYRLGPAHPKKNLASS